MIKTELLALKADLAPEKTWTKTFPVPSQERKYTFELKDKNGEVLVRQTEGKYDWVPDREIKIGPQANYFIPAEAARTEDDWLQAGKDEELDGDKLSATATYEKALRKFPASFELQKAAGRLDTSLQRFAEALPRLTAAATRDTTDGEISYYLAISLEGLGRENDAVDAYEAAMRSPQYRASSALRLAESRARRGEFSEARELISKSLGSSPGDLRALEEQVAILGANGAREEARKQASDLLHRFPLSAFLREELGEPDLEHLSADPYRVLNVATQYARLGLYRRAIEVSLANIRLRLRTSTNLASDCRRTIPWSPTFAGYCRQKLGESGSEDYALASRLSTLYVFPSSAPDKLALEDALDKNPKDATAHSLLGTWYFARAKTPEALREWNAARRLDPQLPALGANIGLALLHEVHDFRRRSRCV